MIGKRRIFIGDIHGESAELLRVLELLNLQTEDELVFLGDYIDKGEDSKGVLAILKQLKEELPQTRFLFGNHELHLYEWLTEGNPLYINMVEGINTLKNLVGKKVHFSDRNVLYGIPDSYQSQEDELRYMTGNIYKDRLKGIRNIDHEVRTQLLEEYLWFFDSLETEADYTEHVAVHGGLNFTKPDPIKDTNTYEKVNLRFFVSGSPLEKPIIVGHTPKKEITLTEDRKMVTIDTGCGVGGKLSALIYYPMMDMYLDLDGKEVNVYHVK